jgi:hypothetical protein
MIEIDKAFESLFNTKQKEIIFYVPANKENLKLIKKLKKLENII